MELEGIVIAMFGFHSNTGSEMSYPICKFSLYHLLITYLSTSEPDEDLRTVSVNSVPIPLRHIKSY